MKQMPPGHLLKETTCCVFLNIIPLCGQIYIYIKKKWKPITPYFNTKLLPPRKLTSLGYKKNTIYIRQVL